MNDPKKYIDIPTGWVAFYNADTKKVFGITEFKSPSKGYSALTVLVKTSKADLLSEFATMGLTYSEPAIAPSPPPLNPTTVTTPSA